MKMFYEYAKEKMRDLYNNHSHEVGSELKKLNPGKYKKFESTDCITYSLNVIGHAFEKTGNSAAAKKVWSLGRRGVDLAKYLVDSHGWRGIYINPDSVHPTDESSEHTYSSYLASKTCRYYQIPLHYKVQNYQVTPKSHLAFQKVSASAGVTQLNTLDYSTLNQIEFGFGLSRGGMHTWLFSKGQVYEVHWDQIGSGLYEASSLQSYPWLSGAIVVPSSQAVHLAATSKVSCGN